MANFSYNMQRPETVSVSIRTDKGFIPFINAEGKSVSCVKNRDGSYLCKEYTLDNYIPFWWNNTSSEVICTGCDTTEETKKCLDGFMEGWKKKNSKK